MAKFRISCQEKLDFLLTQILLIYYSLREHIKQLGTRNSVRHFLIQPLAQSCQPYNLLFFPEKARSPRLQEMGGLCFFRMKCSQSVVSTPHPDFTLTIAPILRSRPQGRCPWLFKPGKGLYHLWLQNRISLPFFFSLLHFYLFYFNLIFYFLLEQSCLTMLSWFQV